MTYWLTAQEVAWPRKVSVAAQTSIAVVVFVFGAILLLLALVGGGFVLKELSFPQVGRNVRVACGITGAFFIGIGLWTGIRGPIITESDGRPAVTRTTVGPPVARTGTDPFPNERERDLLTHVSKMWRAGCHRYNQDKPLLGARAAIQCTPSSGATEAWYFAFDSSDNLYRWYYGVTNIKGISRASGDCAKDQVAEGTWHYNRSPGVDAGHLACWRDGQQSRIAWTHTELHIGAEAYRNDLNDAALYTWWASDGNLLDPGIPD